MEYERFEGLLLAKLILERKLHETEPMYRGYMKRAIERIDEILTADPEYTEKLKRYAHKFRVVG